MKYIIITPVKNESEHIKKTLDSIICQTAQPVKWIIVDDGSVDNTLSILKEYQCKCPWIEVLEKQNYEEERSGGAKVVKAFNYGYSHLNDHDYDFLVKLDGDLILPNDYFSQIIKTFKSDKKIGLCGGYILNKVGDKLVRECELDYQVRGAFKSIRKECFRDIGGFKEIWNWDGMDTMEAFRQGWKSKALEIPVIHLRPTSSAYIPIAFHFKCGFNAYKLRNNLVLALLRATGKINEKPWVLGAVAYLVGYFLSLLKQEPKLVSKKLGGFTNSFHINRITKRISNNIFGVKHRNIST